MRQGAPGPRHRGLDLPIRVRSQPACSGEHLLLRVSSVPTARLPKQVPRVRNRTVCFAGRRILKVTTPKADGAARATTMPVTTRASMSTEVGPGAAAGGGWAAGVAGTAALCGLLGEGSVVSVSAFASKPKRSRTAHLWELYCYFPLRNDVFIQAPMCLCHVGRSLRVASRRDRRSRSGPAHVW